MGCAFSGLLGDAAQCRRAAAWRYPWPDWLTPWACAGEGDGAVCLSIRDTEVRGKRLYVHLPPYADGHPVVELIWASGGDVLSSDGRTATLASSPQVKAALTFYHRMWAEDVINPGAQTDNGSTWLTGFETGKVGMASFGAFAIGTLKAQFPKINFGVTYIPGQHGGWSSFAGGDSIGIPRGSQHINEAWDFIKWCLTNGPQINVLAKTGIVPVRTDLAVNTYSKLEPRYQITANAMAHGRTPYDLHYNELFNDANGPWGALIYQATINGQIDQAIPSRCCAARLHWLSSSPSLVHSWASIRSIS